MVCISQILVLLFYFLVSCDLEPIAANLPATRTFCYCVAWGSRSYKEPQGFSLSLAATGTMSEERALTQALPGNVFHFWIYVVDGGGVVQDAERLACT